MTLPLDNRTLAVFRWPEFGFLGLVMPTFRQTPFRDGRPTVAGDRGRRAFWVLRPRVRTWFRVAARLGVVVKRRVGVVGGRRGVGAKGDGRVGFCDIVRRRSAWRSVREGVGGMVVTSVV